MKRYYQKSAKGIKKLIVYLTEEVDLARYGLFFISGVFLMSWFYYFLTPYSHGIGSNGVPLKDLTFWNSLYFSVVTVSSLGYGDMHPMGISKLLAGAEVLMGLFFMGILLAKMTSARLSYHVARLFSSEIQKRLEEFTENFKKLQRSLKRTAKKIRQVFQQETPETPPKMPETLPLQDRQNIAEQFEGAINSFCSCSTGIAEYLSYEVEHSDFFAIAPDRGMERIGVAIDQASFLLGMMIQNMTIEAKTLLLKPDNRERIFEGLKEQRRICEIVNRCCKKDNVKQKFAQLAQTCERLPENFFAIPGGERKAEQPDQKLESPKRNTLFFKEGENGSSVD